MTRETKMINPSRRCFLHRAAGAGAVVTAPQFVLNLSQAVHAADGAGAKNDKVLVIVQMSGGNDGLNTVVPFGDDAYGRNRFALRLPTNQVHKLNGYLGLHPAMEDLHGLYEDGMLGVVQGVGYPNPNRSHFASMDIWHTARTDAPEDKNPARRTGWVGRYLDHLHGGKFGKATGKSIGGAGDVAGLHLGGERQPLAVVGKDVRVPSVQSVEGFKLQIGNDTALRHAIEQTATARRDSVTTEGDLLSFMQQSTVAAMQSSQRVQQALRDYKTPVKYPGTDLAKKMRTIAQLISSGMSTRVYYVTLGGFDTHSNQGPAHAALMREFSGAVAAFVRDLKQQKLDDRVMVMSFSEFGRRIKENGSRGTDHGVAGPMFIAGGNVKGGIRGGIHGKHPSLTDTDQGDLKHHTDFRQVYATVLKKWLGVNPASVIGGRWETLPLIG